jgi:hypothetical protein
MNADKASLVEAIATGVFAKEDLRGSFLKWLVLLLAVCRSARETDEVPPKLQNGPLARRPPPG